MCSTDPQCTPAFSNNINTKSESTLPPKSSSSNAAEEDEDGVESHVKKLDALRRHYLTQLQTTSSTARCGRSAWQEGMEVLSACRAALASADDTTTLTNPSTSALRGGKERDEDSIVVMEEEVKVEEEEERLGVS